MRLDSNYTYLLAAEIIGAALLAYSLDPNIDWVYLNSHQLSADAARYDPTVSDNILDLIDEVLQTN